MGTTITSTDFKFPHQTSLYHGKVRDVYTIDDELIVSVATDRISAFDVILPGAIPYKGQVLNQLAAHFLKATADIVDNWLQFVPDPNVSVGVKAEPFKIEMVIRGVLVGHAWREYGSGKRKLCGEILPEGLKQYDRLPWPIITPSTKADTGHDEDIPGDEIVSRGLATQEEWDDLAKLTRKLYERGQSMAKVRGLIIADTKYEFGKIGDKIILIDEIHTPDSSRYFLLESFNNYVNGDSKTEPKHLSKEFVRSWLLEQGFSGQADQELPKMSEVFVEQISNRYIELYEKMTGEQFIKPGETDPLKRIETAVSAYLKKGF